MEFETYENAKSIWPISGKHILAQFDAETILVYQAYRTEIAEFALENQKFGGDFSYSRMSWIKPNFLWMMYRAGWATKQDQEMILAVRLKRSFFDAILSQAVASNLQQSHFTDHDAWKAALGNSDVRLQWDPDHAPDGTPLERKAIQLGLRGRILEDYGKRELVEVIDVTPFVRTQRDRISNGLSVPIERVYKPSSAEISNRIGLA